MNFANGTLHNIRSISQRGLAIYWARLAGKGGLVPFEQFEPAARLHDPKQLAVWKVESKPDQIDFRALYRGTLIGEAVHDGWVGRTLSEVVPPPIRDAIVSASNCCASTGCAVYSILRTLDAAGHPVDLERLLLPFGLNGRVKHIVASLQLISLEGEVERGKFVENLEARAECVLAVRIPASGFVESNPARASGSRPVVQA